MRREAARFILDCWMLSSDAWIDRLFFKNVEEVKRLEAVRDPRGEATSRGAGTVEDRLGLMIVSSPCPVTGTR